MMRALVTGGGTEEPIDRVRCLTNRSTGALARRIAEALLGKGWQVVLLCGRAAEAPEPDDHLEVVRFGSFQDLEGELTTRLGEEDFDGVVHGAAVSDFSVEAVVDVERVASALLPRLAGVSDEPDLAARLREALREASPGGEGEGKLSSRGQPLIVLSPNPKLLDGIRARLEKREATLVSFKLLAGVSREELLATARRQMERTGSTYVFANDVARFDGWSGQRGYLVSAQDERFLEGKPAIAEAITEALTSASARHPLP